MRGLALCLAAAVLAVAGCGSDNSSSAPKQEKVTASGSTGAPAAVSAKGRATAASLCAAEGKGKPKRMCVAGLKKLDKGKASNPRAACKGLSKKKTKGVRGKSPYAVCVSAAAKLLASKKSKGTSGNGAADGKAGDTGSAGAADDGEDASGSSDTEADPICVDAKGKVVPFDSEDVEECEPATTSASDSSSSDSEDLGVDDSSSDDTGDGE